MGGDFVGLQINSKNIAVGLAGDIDHFAVRVKCDAFGFLGYGHDVLDLPAVDIHDAHRADVFVGDVEVFAIGMDCELLWIGAGRELLEEFVRG